MPVSEADIELLEAHLDGELSSAEDAVLRQRLSSDEELQKELIAIRADRAIRAEVFESFEPNDLAVRNLVLNVRKQITKDAIHGDRMRILRYVASAAACIMLSFTAGWFEKGRVAGPNTDSPAAVAQTQHDTPGSVDSGGSQLGNQGISTLVSNTNPSQNTVRQSGGYQVNLTDAFGHVIAVQRFNTLDEARQFQADIELQKQQQQQQNRGIEPVDYTDSPTAHGVQF